MQERAVTAAGQRYPLPAPFFVLATQNPIEQEGTYPLPEAQLDRFMFNTWVDYPSFDEEVNVVKQTTSDAASNVSAVISGDEILAYQQVIRRMPVADNVVDYAVNLAASTRPGRDRATAEVNQYLSWGAGPRASQYLIVAAKSTPHSMANTARTSKTFRPSPPRSCATASSATTRPKPMA